MTDPRILRRLDLLVLAVVLLAFAVVVVAVAVNPFVGLVGGVVLVGVAALGAYAYKEGLRSYGEAAAPEGPATR